MKSFYKDRRVLVTGADGFLGINMVQRLLSYGARVAIFSRHSRPRCGKMVNHIFRGDLRERRVVQAAVQNQEIIFDFAGASGAVNSNLEPFRHLENECSPHLSLFQASIEPDPSPVVVFCSTRLVYGKPEYLPVDESHPLEPLNMYAVHKITLENYLKVFASVHDLRSVIIRLSNPYGPLQPEKTQNYGIINLFIRLAAKGLPIEIFGSGSQIRDYVYVDDVVTAFLAVAMTKKCYGEIFNFGGSESISIKEAVQKISRLAGNTPVTYRPWPEEYHQVETGNYQTDMSKINQYVHLSPQTKLDQGFQKSLAFYDKEPQI